MPSDRSRNAVLGFNLLETVLAFSILSILLMSIYGVIFGGFKRQHLAESDYEMTLMARAILDEYVTTYPEVPHLGTYKNTWSWQVTERRVDGLVQTSMDAYFEFYEVRVEVSLVSAPKGASQSLSTIIARRGDGP